MFVKKVTRISLDNKPLTDSLERMICVAYFTHYADSIYKHEKKHYYSETLSNYFLQIVAAEPHLIKGKAPEQAGSNQWSYYFR